ncbi:MAG: DUF1269 domain-containing protein, partial [Variovorax sp.]
MHDLRAAGIDAAHVHFYGRADMDLSELHAASVWQTSDLVHAGETGLVVGGGFGIVVGLATALLFPFSGEFPPSSPQWEAAAVLAVLGGLVGAWSSSMIGVSIPSPRLQRFEGAIAQGRLLLMVDVPPQRLRDVEALLQTAHPEARFEGEERLIPALP